VLDSGWDVFVWAGTETSAKQRQSALLKSDVCPLKKQKNSETRNYTIKNNRFKNQWIKQKK
jgi:hypothetical protein